VTDFLALLRALVEGAVEIELFGVRCRCLGLAKLIEVKRAAGRPKDLRTLAELEAIREAQVDLE